jgi:hypothetical protein
MFDVWTAGFEAAERLNQWNETAGGCGSPYTGKSLDAIAEDIKKLLAWAEQEQALFAQWKQQLEEPKT